MTGELRRILLATDADSVFNEVDAALGDARTQVLRVAAGPDVLPAIREINPDLVVLDLQIGNMGGMAVSLAIRNEESAGRLGAQNVLLLLDRIADVFLARRSDADGWIVKPLNPLRLQRAAGLVMSGGYYTEHLTVDSAEDAPEDNADEANEAAAEANEAASEDNATAEADEAAEATG